MYVFLLFNGDVNDEELNSVSSVYRENVKCFHSSAQFNLFKNSFNNANSIDTFDMLSRLKKTAETRKVVIFRSDHFDSYIVFYQPPML